VSSVGVLSLCKGKVARKKPTVVRWAERVASRLLEVNISV